MAIFAVVSDEEDEDTTVVIYFVVDGAVTSLEMVDGLSYFVVDVVVFKIQDFVSISVVTFSTDLW